MTVEGVSQVCPTSLAGYGDISETGVIVESGISKGIKQPVSKGEYIYIYITNHNRDLELGFTGIIYFYIRAIGVFW